MRIFALIGALAVAGGVFLLVDGGLRVERALRDGSFSPRVWETDFWLAPGRPTAGLGPNARWFLRLGGGVSAALVGMKLVRVATR